MPLFTAMGGFKVFEGSSLDHKQASAITLFQISDCYSKGKCAKLEYLLFSMVNIFYFSWGVELK